MQIKVENRMASASLLMFSFNVSEIHACIDHSSVIAGYLPVQRQQLLHFW